jgi:hypothetical protein
VFINLKRNKKYLNRKRCSRQGTLDGRNGIPSEDWVSQKPPFLIELQNEGRLTIEKIELKLSNAQDQLDSELAKLRTSEIAISKMHDLSEKTALSSQSDFENALKMELLEDDELGESRSVKFRTFSTPFYVLLLIFLGFGEFVITRASFAFLFNEKETGLTSTAMTIATVAVSIGFAHMAGVAWKRSHDKVNFPNDSVFLFWKIMGGVVTILVLVLAASRAANFPVIIDGVNKKLKVGELIEIFSLSPATVFLFFILQFALILVAVGGSYSHYSLPLERIHTMESRSKKRHKKEVKVLKQLANIQQSIAQIEKNRPRLLVQARNEVRSAIHTYNSLAQTYQAANLRARSRTISQELAAFEPPKLELPSWYLELENNS